MKSRGLTFLLGSEDLNLLRATLIFPKFNMANYFEISSKNKFLSLPATKMLQKFDHSWTSTFETLDARSGMRVFSENGRSALL